MLAIAVLLLIIGVVLLIAGSAGPSTVPPVFVQVGWLLFVVGLILLVVALVFVAGDTHTVNTIMARFNSQWRAIHG